MEKGLENRIAELEAELADCRHELQQAREGNLILDNIIETSIDPITVLNSDGRIVRANPAFTNLLGCKPEAMQSNDPILLAFVDEGDHETTYGEPVTIDQAYYEKTLK